MARKISNDVYQGQDESIAYEITTTSWGSNPSGVEVKAYEINGGVFSDASATVLDGTPSVSGDVITLPLLKSLTLGKKYRVEVKFSSGGSVFEPWFYVVCER